QPQRRPGCPLSRSQPVWVGQLGGRRERPFVSLRIAAGVPAISERKVDELLDDRCTGALRALVMRVHVGDEDVHEGRTTHGARPAKAGARGAEIDPASAGAGLHLDVYPACAARRTVDLAAPERFGQEVARRLSVLVRRYGVTVCRSAGI